MSSAAVSMNSADLDLILRERNDYRRQAAKLRQENVSLQGRLATMENLLDEMKCENTDLKLRIASVQQMESGHNRQSSIINAPKPLEIENSDDDIQMIDSPVPKTISRTVQADSNDILFKLGLRWPSLVTERQGEYPPPSHRTPGDSIETLPHIQVKRRRSASLANQSGAINGDDCIGVNKKIKFHTETESPARKSGERGRTEVHSTGSGSVVSDHTSSSRHVEKMPEGNPQFVEHTDTDAEDEDDLYGPSMSELEQYHDQHSCNSTRQVSDILSGTTSPRSNTDQSDLGIGLSHSSESSSGETSNSRFQIMSSENILKSPKLEVEVVIPRVHRMSSHLRNCSDLICDPPPSLTLASRLFLADQYGGSSRQFVVTFPAERNPSLVNGTRHVRHVIFPRRHMNPFMPQEAGGTGLIFSSRPELLKNPPWTVFIRMKPESKGNVQWKYFGEYEFVRSAPMTPAEFSMLTSEVKLNWAKSLIKNKKWDVYAKMRVRIYLRKANITLTALAEAQELTKVKNKEGGKLTTEDVINALTRGDEAIDIIKMRCIKYDRDFARDIRTKWPTWTPPSKKISNKLPGIFGKHKPARETLATSDADDSVSDSYTDQNRQTISHGRLSIKTRQRGRMDRSESDGSPRAYWSGSLTPLSDSDSDDGV